MANSNQQNDYLWVFLSHSLKDYDQVRQLRNIMEDKGMRPLMFFLKCLDEEPEIFDLIKREIDVRPRFILCDSKNAQDSKWVQKEVEYIKSKHRPFVTIDLNKPNTFEERVMELKRRSQIFISASHKDDHIVSVIATSLRNRGFNVFEHKDSILTGVKFLYNIANAITKACDNGYFLPIITPNYCQSRWGEKELLFADEHYPHSLIPCAVANSYEEALDMLEQSSALKYTLSCKQFCTITPGKNFEASVEEFCDLVVRRDLLQNE